MLVRVPLAVQVGQRRPSQPTSFCSAQLEAYCLTCASWPRCTAAPAVLPPTVDLANGSFELPGYPLRGANLPEHVDLDLVLELVEPAGGRGRGQGQQEGDEALPGLLEALPVLLLLQRVYVAARELSGLQQELESINKEVWIHTGLYIFAQCAVLATNNCGILVSSHAVLMYLNTL